MAGVLSSCFAKKKVAKEKATPRAAPATPVPCATRKTGRLRNSGFTLKQSSPMAPGLPALLSAFHGGPKGVRAQAM